MTTLLKQLDTAHPLDSLFTFVERGGRIGLYALCLGLGFLLSRAFVPMDIFPVIFICFPLMVALVDRSASKINAFLLGWWCGFGFFSAGLVWVGHSFTQQDHVPVILAPFATLMLASTMALYVGLIFLVAKALWPRSPLNPLRIVIFASAWIGMEILRSTLFTGFPWHIISAVWANWLPILQMSYYLGVFGLGFLTVLMATVPIILLDQTRLRNRVFTGLLAATIIMAGTLVGLMRLYNNETHFHLETNLRLIQANVQQYEKWKSHLIDGHFDKHLRLSRAGDQEGRAQGIKLLIWPEASVQSDSFDREASIERWRISKLLEFGAFAIVGAPRYQQTPDGINYYNSLFALNRKADLYARYDKHHLIPFGEYMPLQSFFGLIGLDSLATSVPFSSGLGPQTIQLPGIPSFSPLICYEVIFPSAAIDFTQRPEWLLNITNDGWFGLTEGPYQHLALARMRAVEEGLPLVRSAGTGISAVIDPLGRTITQLDLGHEGILESPLPLALPAPTVSSDSRLLIIGFLTSFILIFAIISRIYILSNHG